jgi:hypothetical protein
VHAPRRIMVVAAAVGITAPGLAAQNSVYGIRGLGFPSRLVSVPGRALGGGTAAFDFASPVNPAAVAGLQQVVALAMSSTDFRGYTIDTVAVSGRRATRFPLVLVGGRAGGLPIGYAVSVTSYTERSYDITLTDTIVLRDQRVQVTDHMISRGGSSDMRFALGWQAAPRFRVGAALHLISGSAKLALQREFSDSAYRPFVRNNDEQLDGLGVSAGLIWTPNARLAIGLAGRSDTKASLKVDSVSSGAIDLPVSLVAGVQIVPHRAIRWSTTATWRSWSTAQGALVTHAFDTWEVGSGIELGGPESGASRLPVRVGVRYATLAFSPTDQQPHELDVAIGSGIVFAGRRGVIDIALERALRDGAGASERAWQLSVMMTVRP